MARLFTHAEKYRSELRSGLFLAIGEPVEGRA
jgi:hypothetical protein